jgi:hypothetical protein
VIIAIVVSFLELDHSRCSIYVEAMLIILEQFMQKSEIKYLFCTRKYTDTISDENDTI